MSESKFADSLQHHDYFADGHVTYARCEGCMYGCHFEEVTWHSWVGEDDMTVDAEYNERVKKQKCACDCAGPRGES